MCRQLFYSQYLENGSALHMLIFAIFGAFRTYLFNTATTFMVLVQAPSILPIYVTIGLKSIFILQLLGVIYTRKLSFRALIEEGWRIWFFLLVDLARVSSASFIRTASGCQDY